MSTTDLPDDDTLETLSEEGYTSRKPTGALKYLYYAIGLGMAAFHIWFLGYSSMEPWALYYSHICFGVVLAYFLYPFSRRSNKRMPTLGDWACMLLAASACIYFILELDTIIYRVGVAPTSLDLFFSTVIVVLILEMTRRTNGWILPSIAIFFLAYALLGKYLPYSLGGHRGYSFARVFSYITGMDGMLSTPLATSASFVFLFFLFSAFLASTGAGQFFIDIAMAVAGGKRGGPAKVAVIGSALFGTISGNSAANVVASGTFTIPMMIKVGYSPRFASAVEAVASTGGQMTPPILGAAAFIIAEYVNVPYIEVAKAAAIPAFAAYAGLLWITHVEACKLGLRGLSKSELPSFWTTLKEGLHFLIPICMLLYELIIMQHSAEMSVFRAIVVLALIMLGQPVVKAFVHKKSKRKALKEGIKTLLLSLSAGGSNMAGVAMATASAGIIVGCVSLGLGQQITSFVEILSGGNIFLLLLITALASLLLGMGLPTTANYIIMASLTAPILVQLASGIVVHGVALAVPLIAAHLYCFYFGILADDTPPVGLAAYAAAAIADTSPIATGIQGFLYDIRTAILPLMFIFNHDIILWGIDSVPEGIFLFFMTVLGCMSFASLTQGWFIAKNTLPDALLLACSTIIMLYPALLTGFFLPHDQRYWGYLIGIGIMGLLAYMQHARTTQTTEAAA